ALNGLLEWVDDAHERKNIVHAHKQGILPEEGVYNIGTYLRFVDILLISYEVVSLPELVLYYLYFLFLLNEERRGQHTNLCCFVFDILNDSKKNNKVKYKRAVSKLTLEHITDITACSVILIHVNCMGLEKIYICIIWRKCSGTFISYKYELSGQNMWIQMVEEH
ncbi:hypothetical protein ACJX0J_039526, partial [Zea mays]